MKNINNYFEWSKLIKKYILLTVIPICLFSCAQDGLLNVPLMPPPFVSASVSNVRLLNFGYDADLIINNRMLTDGFAQKYYDISEEWGISVPKLPYFPKEAIWRKSAGCFNKSYSGGNPFQVPDELIDSGKIQVKLAFNWYKNTTTTGKDYPDDIIDTCNVSVTKSTKTYQDVYFYLGGNDNDTYDAAGKLKCPGFRYATGTYSKYRDGKPFTMQTKIVARDISRPTDPTKFKIRLLNLASMLSGTNLSGTGKLTLCFADGTAIIQNVSPGTVSDYVELPYGTLYLRVKNEAGIFLTEKVWVSDPSILPGNAEVGAPSVKDGYSEPYTSGLYNMASISGGYVSNLPFSSIKSYEPGEIYTIVVSPRQTPTYIMGIGNAPTYKNCFELVRDYGVVPNNNYGRMQVYNVMPGVDSASVTIDGLNKQMLKYGQDPGAGNAVIATAGTHTLKVMNAATNQQLLVKQVDLVPGQYVTLWLYLDDAGNPAFISRNLDLTFFSTSIIPNAAGGVMQRFANDRYLLNLTADIPFVKFASTTTTAATPTSYLSPESFNGLSTDVDPQLYYKAKPNNRLPMLNPNSSSVLTYYRAYEVGVGVTTIQGDKLLVTSTVGNLFATYYNLIKPSNPSLSNGYMEQGIYTVALIGRKSATPGSSDALQFVVFNHTK
jgi:hypothetical protein